MSFLYLMHLQRHYDNLWQQASAKFSKNAFELDPLIDGVDSRRGITLLARPGKEIIRSVEELFFDLQSITPNQYFYPSSDMHITIMSIISCYEGFNMSKVDIPEYISLVSNSLKDIHPFRINFKGITASPSCIMIQGFPEGGAIDRVRDELRSTFSKSEVEHSIDKRYSIKTAHLTVVRFRKPISNHQKFLETLEAYRTHDFGCTDIKNLKLVFNDWYQQKEKTKLLHAFTL